MAINFKLRPDLVYKNKSLVRSFLLRKSNFIPDEFIERYSETNLIGENILEKFVAFQKKPLNELVEKCIKKSIGICYISKGKLVFQNPEKIEVLNAPIEAEVVYKMPETHVFFASIQELEERKVGAGIVADINKRYKKGIYATLVEKDTKYNEMTNEKLQEEIIGSINRCEYFLGILTEDPAEAVDLEIRHALATKSFENIFLFVKDNETTKKTWESLLKHIEMRFNIYSRTVWYLEYTDQQDFIGAIYNKIMTLLGKIHARDGAKFLS